MMTRSCRARPSCRSFFSHGFTLIELLVAVSIITLMLSVLLPALGQSRQTAKSAICMSNTRLLAVAANMYAQQERQERWVTYIPAAASSTGVAKDRKELLLPYTVSGKSNADVDVRQLWHCPSNDVTNEAGQVVAAGYGFNTNLNGVRLSVIRRPSETVALADAGVNDAGAPILSTHLMPPSRTTNPGIGRPNPRHAGRVNVGFADGHAATVHSHLPFYPPPPYPWTGVGVTDSASPDYRDQLWDLQ